MIKRVLIILVVFYLLALLQTSFFIHFRIWGIVPNFILISAVLINVFEKPQKNTGIIAGFIGGLFLDIFSSGFIGFYALILPALSFLIKIIFRKYVWALSG
ncbi:MAG: rod shape-determining protein MreD [Candidatus Nealsonbacteria bacterium]